MTRIRTSLRWGSAGLALAWAATAAAQGVEGSVSAHIEVPRARIYVNETIDLTVAIEAAGVRLARGLELAGLPERTRLVVGPFGELAPQKRVENRSIREIRRYRTRCRAVQPGPLDLALRVRTARLQQRRVFLGMQWVERPLEIRVDPLRLQVQPLPDAGRPADFSGAVGTFELAVTPSVTDVAVGDLITVAIAVSGDGYLATVRPPALSPGGHFKVYPPRLLTSEDGRRDYEQILIPLSTNAAAIPPLTFTFFDPAAERYATLRRGPFPLTFHARRETPQDDVYRPATPAGPSETAPPPPPELRPLPASSPELQAAFDEAAQAYRDGYFDASIDAYQRALAQGPATPALLYNLGNAYLGKQAHGYAVLFYRRALYREPRAENTRRHLREAIRRSGAVTGMGPGWFMRLGRREWTLLCLLTAAFAAALVAVRLRTRREPWLLDVLLLLLLAGTVLCGSGWWQQYAWERNAAVVVQGGTARLAPATGAAPSFDCAAGDTVRMGEQAGTWVVVDRNGDHGWLPRAALEPVAPRP